MLDSNLIQAVPGVEGLRATVITPSLFIKDLMKDFKGKYVFNYENWARELINQSTAFMGLTKGESFHAPASEANGECDAVAGNYELDFKLLFGESLARAVSLTSCRYLISRGVVAACSPRAQGSEQKGLRLHAVLREYDQGRLRELMTIADDVRLKEEDAEEIRRFLRTLNHSKNLMLLYPCDFRWADDSPAAEETASSALYYDFRSVLSLRRELHPDKDTYLAYFIQDVMIITKVCEAGLIKFDEVPVAKSTTYMDILRACR